MAVTGALANNFLLAAGYDVGRSLVDKTALDLTKEIYHQAQTRQAQGNFELFLAPGLSGHH